jgi:hypothetical protein
MKLHLHLFTVLALVLVAAVASPAGEEISPRVVSPARVLELLARVPATQRVQDEGRPGGWERRAGAPATAEAISLFAKNEEVAARLAVYAANEGGMDLSARGDGGSALGILQLHNVPESLAFNPLYAVPRWLRLAAWSEEFCGKKGNLPRERLAALASGRCDRGRRLVHRREDIVDLVLGRRAPGEAPLSDGVEGRE